MTTFSATPNTENGSVTLVINKTNTITKVIRTNANGSEEVRASQGQLPSPAGGVELRRNLITNPSAEVNLAGYQAVAGTGGVVATSQETTGGAVSQKFFRTTWTTGNTGGIAGAAYMHTGISGNTAQRYSVSMWVRSNRTRVMSLEIALNISGAGHTYVDSPATTLVADQWTLIKIQNVVPNNTFNEVYLIVYGDSDNASLTGDTLDIDGLLLEQATSVGTYFDGDTTDLDQSDYEWTGTPHASASTSKQASLLILQDFEASNGLNSYNVYSSDGSMLTGSAVLVIDKPWLSVPVMPQYSEQVELITAFGGSRESATTVHRPLGRADSLVVMGKLGDRTGSLEIFCKEYADARRLERVFERGEIVQLRQRVEGMDLYFTVTSIPVSPYSVEGEEATRWAMTVNYVEVQRPIGLLAGAFGWTFDELAASAVSFDVIAQSYTTFDALTLGDANV